VLALFAAAVMTTATGDWTDATVIVLVLVVNTTTGVIEEVKADNAISALTQFTAPQDRGDLATAVWPGFRARACPPGR
jgi:Ca2+-transporting ATPase